MPVCAHEPPRALLRRRIGQHYRRDDQDDGGEDGQREQSARHAEARRADRDEDERAHRAEARARLQDTHHPAPLLPREEGDAEFHRRGVEEGPCRAEQEAGNQRELIVARPGERRREEGAERQAGEEERPGVEAVADEADDRLEDCVAEDIRHEERADTGVVHAEPLLQVGEEGDDAGTLGVVHDEHPGEQGDGQRFRGICRAIGRAVYWGINAVIWGHGYSLRYRANHPCIRW